MTWIWWAPLVAASLHIVEEFVWPGGFAAWDRTFRPEIKASITPRLHVIVNAALLYLCLAVAVAGQPDGMLTIGSAHLRSVPQAWGPALWIGVAALLASNTMFHVVGALQTRRYSPGIVTGVALYLPLAVAGYTYFIRTGQVSVTQALLATAIGGSYHLWAAWAHSARARARAAPAR
jgi:hypothetical protein